MKTNIKRHLQWLQTIKTNKSSKREIIEPNTHQKPFPFDFLSVSTYFFISRKKIMKAITYSHNITDQYWIIFLPMVRRISNILKEKKNILHHVHNVHLHYVHVHHVHKSEVPMKNIICYDKYVCFLLFKNTKTFHIVFFNFFFHRHYLYSKDLNISFINISKHDFNATKHWWRCYIFW